MLDLGDVPLAHWAGGGELRFLAEGSVRLTNYGTEAADVTAAGIGTSRAFSIVRDDCTGARLEPGESCEVTVRFLPAEAGGFVSELEVQTAEGVAPLVVPISGDAVDLACEGSRCEAPPYDFGSYCPGTVLRRTLGFRNDTGGEVLANFSLEGTPAWIGPETDTAAPVVVGPGEEFSLAFSVRYEGDPGERSATSVWSVPPPMLPVVREVVLPLAARVRSCEATLSLIQKMPDGRFSLAADFGCYSVPVTCFATEDRRLGEGSVLYRSLVLGRSGTGPALAVTTVRPDTPADLQIIDLPAEAGAHSTIILRRDPDPIDKSSPLLHGLVLGRKKGYRLDAREMTLREFELPLREEETLTPVIEVSPLFPNTLYGVVESGGALAARKDHFLARFESVMGRELATRAREQVLALREKHGISVRQDGTELPALAVRAMDSAVLSLRRAESFRHNIVMTVLAARYGTSPADAEERLVLRARLGKGGVWPNAPRTGWGWRRAAITGLVVRNVSRLADESPLPSRMLEEATEPPEAVLEVVTGFSDGTLALHLVWKLPGEDDWTWTFLGRTQVGHDIIAMRPKKSAGAARELLVAGRSAFSRLRAREIGTLEKVFARPMPPPPDEEFRGLAVPRFPETALRRDKAFLLTKPIDKPSPCLWIPTGWDDPGSDVMLGSHGSAPVVITGGVLRVTTPDPEADSAEVTLSAYAWDFDHDPIFWSWLAPGVELDDPTSPEPTGVFPLGETVVYVVVRDGPPDDPEALESTPQALKVIVEREGCDDLFFDLNGDGSLDLSDAIYELRYLFSGGPAPVRLEAADMNGDGQLDVSDPVYLLLYLFRGGPAPVCPR